jgi:hypothetical protein
VSWVSPDRIGKRYGVSRDAVYRHAHALGLMEKRRRNVRSALERIIEKTGEVEVSASAVVILLRRHRAPGFRPNDLPELGLLIEAPEKNVDRCQQMPTQSVLRSPACQARIAKDGRTSPILRMSEGRNSLQSRLYGGESGIRTPSSIVECVSYRLFNVLVAHDCHDVRTASTN